MPPEIRIRRVYEEPAPADGTRVLVDRLWPRGLRKDAAALDDWAKDVAPSTELREWYGHDPARFDEFRRRYLDELSQSGQRAALGRLRALASAAAPKPLTLLTATRDVEHSQAAVLAQILRQDVGEPGSDAGDAACWANLVCPECGAIESEGHRPGCSQATSSG
jgi:uncharacterized protein YeaO (DUF488 family)